MDAQARDIACFEAGIKLGTLYHQFVGTPVSPETAPGLAKAMADAISRQPGCQAARVDLDTQQIERDLNRYGYTEVRGHHIDATVTIEYEGVVADAEITLDDGYPLMHLTDITID